MKKLFYVFGISSVLFTACVSNPEGKKAETTEATEVAKKTGTELNVNTSTSKIVWTGKKVSGTHHGEIQIKSGSVNIEGDKIAGGQFIIDMNTLINKDLESYKEVIFTFFLRLIFFQGYNLLHYQKTQQNIMLLKKKQS